MKKNQKKETLTAKLKISKKSGQVPSFVLCAGISTYSGSQWQRCCCA